MPKPPSAQPRQTCCIKIPSATATARAPLVTLAGTIYNVNNERRSGDASFDAAWLLTIAAFFLLAQSPSRETAQWRWLTWGSAFAAIGWVVVSILFSWYAAHFGTYYKTYGSLGAVIAFMSWMWLSSIVILLGAELDAVLEHHTLCDTTRSPSASKRVREAQIAGAVGRESD